MTSPSAFTVSWRMVYAESLGWLPATAMHAREEEGTPDLATARAIAERRSREYGHAEITGAPGFVETWVSGRLHSAIYPPAVHRSEAAKAGEPA